MLKVSYLSGVNYLD